MNRKRRSDFGVRRSETSADEITITFKLNQREPAEEAKALEILNRWSEKYGRRYVLTMALLALEGEKLPARQDTPRELLERLNEALERVQDLAAQLENTGVKTVSRESRKGKSTSNIDTNVLRNLKANLWGEDE